MFKAVLRFIATVLLSLAVGQVSANETVKVDVPHFEPLQLTFRAFDPQHVLINESVILSAIAQKLSATTRWPLRVNQPDTKDAVLDTGGRTKLVPQEHRLAIQYIATSRYLSGGSTGTVLTIPVTYAIDRTPDTVKITLTFPDHAFSLREGLPFITRKLWDINEILEDYSSLAQSLQAVELKLNCQAQGELESPYKQDAVLGNLERMLGRPTNYGDVGAQIGSSGSVTRDATYVYTVRGERRQVKVSTFPYHDGSKVSYIASLPYTLRSDGTSTGDDAGTELHDLLQKIVSD